MRQRSAKAVRELRRSGPALTDTSGAAIAGGHVHALTVAWRKPPGIRRTSGWRRNQRPRHHHPAALRLPADHRDHRAARSSRLLVLEPTPLDATELGDSGSPRHPTRLHSSIPNRRFCSGTAPKPCSAFGLGRTLPACTAGSALRAAGPVSDVGRTGPAGAAGSASDVGHARPATAACPAPCAASRGSAAASAGCTGRAARPTSTVGLAGPSEPGPARWSAARECR